MGIERWNGVVVRRVVHIDCELYLLSHRLASGVYLPQPAIVSTHFGATNFGLAWGMISYFAALGSVLFSVSRRLLISRQSDNRASILQKRQADFLGPLRFPLSGSGTRCPLPRWIDIDPEEQSRRPSLPRNKMLRYLPLDRSGLCRSRISWICAHLSAMGNIASDCLRAFAPWIHLTTPHFPYTRISRFPLYPSSIPVVVTVPGAAPRRNAMWS